MSWRIKTLIGLVALVSVVGCAPETVMPGSQDIGDFEDWGSGIEGFSAAPVTDTGNAGSTDGTYDGAYAGTYNMTLSYNGYVCSFTSVTLQVLITNGDISTPFMTTASADCDLSFGTNTYSPQVYFDGLVLSGGVLSGTLSEDSQFVFESAWSGTVSDLGSGAYQIFANFEQEVTTAFPGSPTTVSGSFILNKQ
jgi:hypothetical protein